MRTKKYNLKKSELTSNNNRFKNTLNENNIANSSFKSRDISKFNQLQKGRKKVLPKIIKILAVIIFVLMFGSITFYRNRQLCTYKSLVDSGRVEQIDANNLCKNFFNPQNWLPILLDTFKFGFKNSFKIKEDYNYKSFLEVDACTNALDPVCWVMQLDGELKQTNGLTNILLVGTDSRIENNLEGNTDSIILASFNNTTGELLLISFPRDTLVLITSPFGSKEYVKINSIYAWYAENGLNTMNNAIKEITGYDVHYHVYFNFDTFREVIDEIGGIKMNLKEPFYDAFPRNEIENFGRVCIPADFDFNYCIVQFPEGEQIFDSADALIYSRSRQLSSDYLRAQRQQEIIKAVMKDILNSKKNAREQFETYSKLYNKLSSSVITNIELKDVAGLFKFYTKITGDVATIVADPTIANGSIIFEAGVIEGFGYSTKFYDYSYLPFQKLLADTWQYLGFYIEKPKIKIINTNVEPIADDSQLGSFINNPVSYVELQAIQDLNLNSNGIRIYDFTNGEKSESIRLLRRIIPNAFLYNHKLEGINPSNFGEDILVLVGK